MITGRQFIFRKFAKIWTFFNIYKFFNFFKIFKFFIITIIFALVSKSEVRISKFDKIKKIENFQIFQIFHQDPNFRSSFRIRSQNFKIRKNKNNLKFFKFFKIFGLEVKARATQVLSGYVKEFSKNHHAAKKFL